MDQGGVYSSTRDGQGLPQEEWKQGVRGPVSEFSLRKLLAKPRRVWPDNFQAACASRVRTVAVYVEAAEGNLPGETRRVRC